MKALRGALKAILDSATLQGMGIDQSFGKDGISIIPERCFNPERIQVRDEQIIVAGFLDGVSHVSSLTPGGQCTDAPVAEEEIVSREKLFGGSFLFCDSAIVLGGLPALPGKHLIRMQGGRWIIAGGPDSDFLIFGEQAFTGRLGEGRVLMLGGDGSVLREIKIQHDSRFVHDGVHKIRRQGDYLYLYWVFAPRLHEGAVARCHLDGTLDRAFGDEGIVRFPTEHGPRGRVLNFLRLNDIVVQPDGKILVGGEGNDANIIRLLSNGVRDTSFGTQGSLVFRADERSTLTGLWHDESGIYAFGDQNGRNHQSHYIAKISHSGELIRCMAINGKGMSRAKDVAVHQGEAFILLHFDSDSQMHNCAAIAKIRL
ncbi:MAG: hypothetical protein B0A82_00440 [Alkalinema sp. CACIAM 70d]|nr:MAG: hypothetical protein B0A82_00440 [Alkalinema sp. CACIAM 70d]